MATKSQPKDDATNVAVNKDQHDFSGETVKVRFFKAEGNEAKQIFVQLNSYTALYKRDVDIVIPIEVYNHLENLKVGVLEPDESDPDNRSKDVWVDRPRFPCQRLSA